MKTKHLHIRLTALLCIICIGNVIGQDTLIYPITPTYDPTQTQQQSFDLGDPTSIQQTIIYDPITGTYVFKESIGVNDLNYRNPSMMTFEEYIEYERQKSLRENWKSKIDDNTAQNQPIEFPITVPGKLFENFSDQIKLQFDLKEVLNFHLVSTLRDTTIQSFLLNKEELRVSISSNKFK